MKRPPLQAFLLVSLLGLSASSCAPLMDAVSNYQSLAHQVSIGDSKEKALRILLPTQDNVGSFKRAPEMFTVDNDRGGKSQVEIYYFLSSLQPPYEIATDDEYTPYVFKDGVLSSVGWTALGGPKTTGVEAWAQVEKARALRPKVIIQNPQQQQQSPMPQIRSTTCLPTGPGITCQSF